MILKPPFFISARLLPAVRIGDMTLSMEMLPRESDGRNRYRYFFDFPKGKSVEGADLRSGCQGGTLVEGFGSLLAFLDSAASSASSDKCGFPPKVLRRVSDNESEVGALREQLEPNGRTDNNLIQP